MSCTSMHDRANSAWATERRPKQRESVVPRKWNLLRTELKLFPSVSTCFAGIPSDRILFPSERGDSTSFFQYMNSWSLTANAASPEVGAWREEQARRWASELVSSVPCVDSGVAAVYSPASKRKHAAALRTTMRPLLRHKVPGRMRGEEPLAAPLQRSLTQSWEIFFLSLVFSSLLRLWEEKKNYEHRKRIKRRSWQPVFLLQSRIYVEVGCVRGCAEWTRAHRAETQSPLQGCSESLCDSPACLIVKEGGGRAKFLLREKGGNTLHKLWQKLT